MIDKILKKFENAKGRKMAAHDLRVMQTTIELRKWVNAQRRISLAAKRTAAKQVKRTALGKGEKGKGHLQGCLLENCKAPSKNAREGFSFDCV